jgi:hypothetical protein
MDATVAAALQSRGQRPALGSPTVFAFAMPEHPERGASDRAGECSPARITPAPRPSPRSAPSAARSQTMVLSTVTRAALGVRMHSGWGVLVAVSGDGASLELVERRRIVVADPTIRGARQPYHHAATLGLPESERYLANCAAVSEGLAVAAVREAVRELEGRHYRVVGAAVLLASGRALPSLANILASHPLKHTAEGEFFRNAVRHACERLHIPVTATKERDLDEQADIAFGKASSRVRRRISSLGRPVGPPWTKDHKTAALAATMILARKETR